MSLAVSAGVPIAVVLVVVALCYALSVKRRLFLCVLRGICRDVDGCPSRCLVRIGDDESLEVDKPEKLVALRVKMDDFMWSASQGPSVLAAGVARDSDFAQIADFEPRMRDGARVFVRAYVPARAEQPQVNARVAACPPPATTPVWPACVLRAWTSATHDGGVSNRTDDVSWSDDRWRCCSCTAAASASARSRATSPSAARWPSTRASSCSTSRTAWHPRYVDFPSLPVTCGSLSRAMRLVQNRFPVPLQDVYDTLCWVSENSPVRG